MQHVQCPTLNVHTVRFSSLASHLDSTLFIQMLCVPSVSKIRFKFRFNFSLSQLTSAQLSSSFIFTDPHAGPYTRHPCE
jgi:hypothetical protein